MTESQMPQVSPRQATEAHIVAKAWKDESYKQELLSNPKAIIEQEFGVELPPEINVQVLEETPTNLYFVLPNRPQGAQTELTDEQLEAIAGGSWGSAALSAIGGGVATAIGNGNSADIIQSAIGSASLSVYAPI